MREPTCRSPSLSGRAECQVRREEDPTLLAQRAWKYLERAERGQPARFLTLGGPLLILSFLMILMGVYKNGEGPSGLLTLPEAAWEISLGIYCAWKGFRLSSPIANAPGDDRNVSSG